MKRDDEKMSENLVVDKQDLALLPEDSMVAVLDSEGKLRYVSDTSATFLEASQQVLGISVFEFIHPEDLPVARRLFGAVVKKVGSSGRTELRIRTVQGE